MKIKNYPLLLVSIVYVLLAGPPSLCAQSENASISGLVADPSGAVVPGATISLKAAGTNQVVTATSGQGGFYSFPNLLPGVYDLTASARGFSDVIQKGITVNLAARVTVNVTLTIGTATQTVEVSANASPLNYETPVQRGTITPGIVLDLPLLLAGSTRNAASFVNLLPGVTQGGGSNAGNSATRINGGQNYQDEAIQDGVSLTGGLSGQNGISQTSGTNGFALSPEGVQEIAELTSNYDAQFGTTTSGVLTAVTKSGTDQWHGSMYEYARNYALNARQFGVARRPKDIENDFGGSVGGPLNFIPGLRQLTWTGKKKTYFFANYEAFRIRGAATTPVISVPTAQEKQGDFSDWKDASGNLIPLYDPATTVSSNGTVTRQQFMGCGGGTPNVICPSDPRLQSSQASAWLKYLPSPNLPGLAANYTPPSPPITAPDTTLIDVRVDHYYGDKDHFDVTAHYHGGYGPTQTVLPVQIATESFSVPNYVLHDTLSWDHTIHPNMVNSFHAGYNDSFVYTTPADKAYASAVPQMTGVTNHTDPPELLFADSYTQIGNNYDWFEVQPNIIANDLLMWVRGKHTLRFGGEYRASETRASWFASNFSGIFNFNDLNTGLPTIKSGNSMASFLLGAVNSASDVVPTVGVQYARMKYWDAYASDTWRVTPRLTVDYGLRWDVSIPASEKYNRFSDIDPYVANPGAGGRLGAVVYMGNYAGAASLGRSYPENVWYRGFSPRLGFAYSPSTKTVVRGGYGIFYETMPYRDGGNGVLNALDGFNARPSFSSPDTGVTPAFMLQNGFPQNFTRPPFISLTFDNGQVPSVYRQFGRVVPPYSQQWNFTVEHQFTNNFHISAAYVANKGTHIISYFSALNVLNPSLLSMGSNLTAIFPPSQTSLNGVAIPYTGWVQQMSACAPTVAQALDPFPQFCGTVLPQAQYNGYSNFNSLQVQAENRFSHGLWLLASYTYSKFLSTGDSQAGSIVRDSGMGPFQQRRAYALDADDVPQTLVASILYDLPVGKGKRFLNQGGALNWIFGDWQWSNIFRGQSGTPFSFTSSVCNIPGQFAMSCYPAILPGANPWLQPENGSINLSKPLFNVAAFEPASAFNFYSGQGPARMALRGFPFYNHDLSLMKTISVKERLHFSLGAQFFNIWNWHSLTSGTTFAGSQTFNTNVASPTFGMWTGGVSAPRNIQVFGRFSF